MGGNGGSGTVNVVICDDHRLFSEALARVLTARSWNIVACAIDPAHAVAAVAREQVDACLMDLTFSDGVTGLEGIGAVRRASPHTRVVVLTASSDPKLIMRAVEAGADAILFKDDDIDHIVEIVERTDQDRPHAAPRPVPEPRVAQLTSHADPASLGRFLTDREHEVLECLMTGASGKHLALRLGISYSTARTHIQNVLAKLGVHSRLEAVAFAVEHDLCSSVRTTAVATTRDRGAR